MELLFIVLGGTIFGLGARYLFPHRETHGVILLPAIGASVAAVIWVTLTWLGFAWDGGWIWTITLVGTALTVSLFDLFLGRARRSADQAQLTALLSPKSRTS